ncbi:MAG TPA: Nif3-like dinuclear metal center hexameric protein [Firmicutes bacterium]|nr:Nif3-like dinuclear metal center hexameric protein [Bacillota bacterium]
MAAQISALIGVMERIAPRRLALDWDREHIGLAVGSPESLVERVMVALDPTPEAVEQARAAGAGLLITHHPLLFRPLAAVRTDRPVGSVVAAALASGVALFSAHTNLDVAEGGVSDVLADLLGLEEIEPLQVTARESLLKLVVFVPESHVDKVRQALGDAGAGHLGRYSHCTFSAPGTGTFLPEQGAHPFIGQSGTLARVAEARVETILPEDRLPAVLRAVREVHPYEEIAYDVYPLCNEGKAWGLGRLGRLPEEQSLSQLLQTVRRALGAKDLSYVGNPGRRLRKVAVCGGSAGDLVPQAVFRGAEVLIAGEIKYHDGLLARQEGLAVVVAGHDATERPVVPVLARRLRGEVERLRLGVEVLESPPDGGLWQTAP